MPLAKMAAKIMAGKTLKELRLYQRNRAGHTTRSKKQSFPFLKFPGSDVILGPEMLSTGEVMGISDDFGMAYAKSQIAAGHRFADERNGLYQHQKKGPRPNRGSGQKTARDGL